MQCIYTILWGRRFVQPETVDQREWWWNHYVVLSENHRSRLVSLVWSQYNNMNIWGFKVGDMLLITFANALTLICKLVTNMRVFINGFLEVSYRSMYVRLLSLRFAATPWTSKSGFLVDSGVEAFVLLWLLGYFWKIYKVLFRSAFLCVADEWDNFLERVLPNKIERHEFLKRTFPKEFKSRDYEKLKVFTEKDQKVLRELRLWASYRGQTLARTGGYKDLMLNWHVYTRIPTILWLNSFIWQGCYSISGDLWSSEGWKHIIFCSN